MKYGWVAAGVAAAASMLMAGCASSGADRAASAAGATYVAQLAPLNENVTDSATRGQARLEVRGDELKIDIRVEDAPAGIEHWQHFHGLTDGGTAVCPTIAADTNGDGIVDLIETEPASGTTMVPFISHPASMDVPGGQYPVADASGSYHYQATVSLSELSRAFAEAFDGQALDLDKRVIYIHGVPQTEALPATVQSLGPIPATTTLPIACGQLARAG